MSRAFPAKRAAEIMAVVSGTSGGAGFVAISAALTPPAPTRNVKRWLSMLVRERRLIRVGRSSATRYTLPASDVVKIAPSVGTSVQDAVRRLVSLPLSDRMPVEYHRVLLDVHRPDETYYLSVDEGSRALTAAGDASWREKAGFDRKVAELAVTILALEDALDPSSPVSGSALTSVLGGRRLAPLTVDELVGWLAEPPRPGVRADAQLAWAVRAVLVDLENRNPKPIVSSALLGELYAQVTARLSKSPISAARGGGISAFSSAPPLAVRPPSSVGGTAPVVLRAASLLLPGTVYSPLGDGMQIQACFDQMVRLAAAISSPVDQAFFLLLHLLYLLPFPTLNSTMALLAMNVPLLSAGLSPTTLSGVSRGDLLTALRGVWELNRPELLAEAFAAPNAGLRGKG